MAKITLITAIVAWLSGAWSLMLTIGIAHAQWWSVIPVIGFRAALAILAPGVLIMTVCAFLKGGWEK